MVRNSTGGIALRCGTVLLLPAIIATVSAHAQEKVTAQDQHLQFDEIIVTAKRNVDDLTEIAPDAASLLATAGDVNDPLKALLSLPGISFGGGDLDQPVIRGGGPSDNLFLIDGMPVDNVFHELSDSIVSPNVIRTFDLHSAAFSPEYGNASGGVIDIGLRDPNPDERYLKVDLSQLKSGVLIETPVTDSVAGYASYRHNLAHLFLKEFERGNDVLVFQMPESRDYTGRLIWRSGQTDIALTAIGSWDKTEERPREGVLGIETLGQVDTRQFDGQSLRIRTELGDQTHLTATFSHSRTSDDQQENNGNFVRHDASTLTLRSKIRHQAGSHDLVTGINISRTDTDLSFRGAIPICDSFEQGCGFAVSLSPTALSQNLSATEFFVTNRIEISDRFQADLGVHAAIDHFLDESFVEPRLGLTLQASKGLDIYTRAGFHHSSPNSGRLLLLRELGRDQESERSRQFLFGQRWQISDDWRLQTEVWYKDFERRELIGSPLERDLDGEAYGLDILLAKPIGGRFYGWAALSLSEGTLKDRLTGLRADNRFTPAVSLTVAVTYEFDHGWKLGAKYRMQSGDRFTPLSDVGFDPTTNAIIPRFGDPFSGQLTDYHRLDIRLEKAVRFSFGDVSFYADVLNATDRTNIANRTFPLRNTVISPNAPARIIPDDEEGIPLFVAFGVNFSF